MSALNPIRNHATELDRLAWLDLHVKGHEKEFNRLAWLDLQLKSDAIPELPKNSSLIGRVKVFSKDLKNAFYKKCSATNRARFTQFQSFARKSKKLIALVVKVADPLLGIFRNAVLAGGAQLERLRGLVTFAEKTKIISVILLPLGLVGAVKNAVDTTKACLKGSAIKACEKGMELIESLGGLCFSVEQGIQTVYSFADLTISAVAKIACAALAAVGTVFSLASIGINAKQWYECVQFEKRNILKYNEINNQNFKAFVDKVNVVGNSRLARQVGVSDGKKFKGRISAIYARNSDPDKSVDSKEKINGLMEALKKRITSKKISHALTILVAVVSIVAAGILFFTPLAPLGYSLLIATTLIGIGILIKEYRAEKDLNKFLKSFAPDNCYEIQAWNKKQKRREQMKKDPVVATWLSEAKLAEKRRCETLQKTTRSS